MIENGLHLVGATAVEDKLQDGVPETITALRNAGIQVRNFYFAQKILATQICVHVWC